MATRQNTIVCTFELNSPKITAFEIHEWIHNTLLIPEHDVTMIQVNGIKRQLFIKMINNVSVQTILKETNGEAKYKHHSGEMCTVGIDVAGLGTKRVRIANLPPERPDTALKTSLAPYGKIQKIQHELWTQVYRYPVSNGIRQMTITLTKHIPFHLLQPKTESY
jgi:hypothetical protein